MYVNAKETLEDQIRFWPQAVLMKHMGLEVFFIKEKKTIDLEEELEKYKEYRTPADKMVDAGLNMWNASEYFKDQFPQDLLNVFGIVAKKEGMALGGFVPGVGLPQSDNVLARLSPGEFIVNARSAGRFSSQLRAMNAGITPTSRARDHDITIGDIHVHAPATATPRTTALETAREIRREVRRGAITVQ